MGAERSVALVAFSAVAALGGVGSSPALGAVITFYGFDSAAVGGPHPNSDAARLNFLSQLVPGTVGIEDFEGDSTGSFLGGSRTLAFPPTADSGTLQSLATFSADIMNVSFPGAFGPILEQTGFSSEPRVTPVSLNLP